MVLFFKFAFHKKNKSGVPIFYLKLNGRRFKIFLKLLTKKRTPNEVYISSPETEEKRVD